MKRAARSRGPRIAIVGGGFSGTAVLANLVERAAPGTTIELFEARDEAGPGLAYGTREACHLLNVQAARMGALSPEDFVRWLESGAGNAAAHAFGFGPEIPTTAYLPRALYGAYLKALLHDTLRRAIQRGLSVTMTRATVTNVCDLPRTGVEIACEFDGAKRRDSFDVLILATGHFSPAHPHAASLKALRSAGYVQDIWSVPEQAKKRIRRLSSAKTIMILGTGLTAVDAVLALKSWAFKGKIIMVSRNGRLPCEHAAALPQPWTWVVQPDDVPATALGTVEWLRQEARRAAAEGADWRGVFEALRPHTQRIWRTLDAAERRKLLRRHSLWSIHRHRMAPEVASQIASLQAEARLEIVPAQILLLDRRLSRFRAQLRRRGKTNIETLRPSLVLNCTGPETDIARIEDPLIRNLARRGLIAPSQGGPGIAVDEDLSVVGASHRRIFAIGPLLLGELFECTAVPELRELAKQLASQVVESLAERRGTLTSAS